MAQRVADILVETLQAAGVKRCYGIVGDTLNQIARAINVSDIEWVHMRHEEAGAFAARAARSRSAGRKGQSDAARDAAVAIREAGGRGRNGRRYRQGHTARQGPRCLGNGCGQYPLICIRRAKSVQRTGRCEAG
jgi:Thiamine pyrophosphate enzyme, N-terminal TPP binding domain